MKNLFLILTLVICVNTAANKLITKAKGLVATLEQDFTQYRPKKKKRIRVKINELAAIINNSKTGSTNNNKSEGALRIDNGFLEVFVQSEWKGVCDDNFDQSDGEVACRQLGGTYSAFSSTTGAGDEFWLDDLNCNGDEQFLTQCSHSGIGNENCSNSEHVKLVCTGLPLSKKNKRSIRNTTVLEVLHNGEWKGVCDDGFDQSDAEVACRQMGKKLVRFNTSVTHPSDDFWLDDLNCNGTEDSLMSCGHSGLGSENCSSGEHIQLICK